MKQKMIFTTILFFGMLLIGSSAAYAASQKKVERIEVSYDKGGEALLVGTEYDAADLTVTAYYTDGTSEQVAEYVTGSRKILKQGENVFVIVYGGKNEKVTIYGKVVQEIAAIYTGGEHSVGNKINEADVQVTVIYSDSSSELLDAGYNLTQTVVTRVGENTVSVLYNGKRTTFTVIGTAAKTVQSVSVTYMGTARPQGSQLRSQDILLTAMHTDGTSEVIYNYTLSPASVINIGANTITIAFKGRSAQFTVEGVEKFIKKITAKYTGGTVAIGKKVKLSDIVVTALYSDETEGQETDFDVMGGGRITMAGSNILTIDAQGQKAEITVQGVEATAADFASVPQYTVSNSGSSGVIAVDIPAGYQAEGLSVKEADALSVRRMMNREVADGEYIPFTIALADIELDGEFPMTVQVTLPEHYKVKASSVYFSPNGKSVIAKMNTEIVEDRYLQFQMYHEGTYILSYDHAWTEEAS